MSEARAGNELRIAVLVDRVRMEEKLLLQAFQSRNIAVDVRDNRELVFDLVSPEPGSNATSGSQSEWIGYDVVLERSVTLSRAAASLQILNDWGVSTINRYQVVQICSDKLATS